MEPGTRMKTEKMLDRQDHDVRVKRRKMQDGIESESDSSVSEFKKKFQDALLAVGNFDRKSKIDVFDAIKYKYPDIIRKPALLVTALPPTQVSVERLFSALGLIKTDQRAAMKEKLTEASLFLRANY